MLSPQLNIGKHIKCTASTFKKTLTFSLIFIMFVKSINLYCTFSTECILIPLILKKIHEASTLVHEMVKSECDRRVAKTRSFQGKPNEKNNTSQKPEF